MHGMASSGAVFAAGPVGILVGVVLRQQERTHAEGHGACSSFLTPNRRARASWKRLGR